MQSLDPHDPHDLEASPAAGDHDTDSDTDDLDDASDLAADVAAGSDDVAYDVVSERDVPTAPTTGDAVVDAAMIELAAAEAGSLSERIEAGERAHRVLQGRLSDLGGA
jgi:hypothetical protein